MEYTWGNSSHETPRQQLDIMLTYTNCPFDHSLNIPHDCIYDLETCGLFEPSGPSGSPRSLVCAACHYPRSLHRSITSTPLHHIMARSPARPYNPAHQGEASTWLVPEMTSLPLPCPPPASEPGPAERQPVRNLTPDRSKRLKEIAKEHDYCALKDYTKAEAQQICAELGIKKKCLSDWISRHNLKRKRAAKQKAAAKEEAAREAAANEEAAT